MVKKDSFLMIEIYLIYTEKLFWNNVKKKKKSVNLPLNKKGF